MSRASRIEALKQAAKERVLVLDGSWLCSRSVALAQHKRNAL